MFFFWANTANFGASPVEFTRLLLLLDALLHEGEQLAAALDAGVRVLVPAPADTTPRDLSHHHTASVQLY